jgi:pectinesterase
MKSITYLFFLFLVHQSFAQPYDLVVDCSGKEGFRTLTEAIAAAPIQSSKPFSILIRKGVYEEKLVIPAEKTNLVLIGEDQDQTIISYNDHSGKGDINTFTSYTLKVAGAGFQAHQLTIRNTAGFSAGQAVALHLEADRAVIRNCRIVGDQDALFADGNQNRQYLKDCYIEGTTDFIFGSATAYFENCTIHSKKKSHITAASTSEQQQYGYVFRHCRFTAAPGIEEVSLGRPWRPFAAVAYLDCELGAHIKDEGWHNWDKPEREATVRYYEFRNTGPGAGTEKRVKWAKQLSRKEARNYVPARIFGSGADFWKL